MKIGMIAALPGELKPLVRRWERLPSVAGSGIRMWERPAAPGRNEVVAVCAGMGAAAARRAFTAAEFRGAMDVVFSVGWAGALSTACSAGESFEAGEVIDAQTGERFSAAGGELRLVTSVNVAGQEEKRRLHESYGAALVDMEASTVARLALMRGIPFRCLKAVSDGIGSELPDINPFLDGTGGLRMTRFLAYVAVRPAAWGALLELGRHSAASAKRLAQALDDVLARLEE